MGAVRCMLSGGLRRAPPGGTGRGSRRRTPSCTPRRAGISSSVMSDPAAPPGPHARFPFGPALLCVACLGMAAWTWMRYSYAWDVVPTGMLAKGDSARKHPLVERYVRLQGYVRCKDWNSSYCVYATVHGVDAVVVDRASGGTGVGPGSVDLYGRVYVYWPSYGTYERGLRVDSSASRFHPASVAGLVVTAFGAFVFALHLRRWLVERREAREAATPSAPL